MLTSLRHVHAPRIVSPYTRATQLCAKRRTYASITDLAHLPQPGSKLHGFTLQRTKHVPELELSALLFQHDKTGADYLHVAREDKNNVFSIGFKTNPPDATGVPHILEHVTLCGSEKYPVRDPFFKMLPRSLQNFMNAFTASDYTMYPFATTNSQDFKNLMSVYLDATLHPLLKRSDFVQEGWRIGPENPLKENDEAGKKDLVFKGVVYNEMKGQMSDATYLFYIRFMEHINPAINNSGGDPSKMTDLTYDQLRNFHKEHYHPSNAKILTYGDQPIEGHLEMLGEQLTRFSKENVDREIKDPITLDGPKEVRVQGPFDPLTPPENQFKTSTTWTGGDSTNIQETFALQLASSLLLDGYGSPMYRALIESGLGTDFTPNTGYDIQGRKGLFTVGVNGVSEANLPKVKETIATTLRETVGKGFDQQKIEGILHQLELSLKHKTANFGFGLIQKLKPGWFNGIDPMESLSWNSIVDSFKSSYAKGGYLEGLVEKYFLNNNDDKTLTFTMAPSQTFAAELVEEEGRRLERKIEEAVSGFPSEEEAHKALRERELELIQEQDAGNSEDLDSLPTLHVSDIPRQQPKIDVRDSSTLEGRAKVQWRETATNGLTYFRALALFKDLPDELRMLIPLFCDSLMRIGTKHKSMEELEDLIKLKTGGIGFGYHSTPSPFNFREGEEGLSLSGYALDRNVSAMFELLQTLLVETDFEGEKARKMVKQLLTTGASGAVDEIASEGHGYAMLYSEAGLTGHGRRMEQIKGLTQVKLITSLAAAEEEEGAMQELVGKLKAIQAVVVANLRDSNVRVALTCGSEATGPNEAALEKFLRSTASANLPTPPSSQQGLTQGQAHDYPAGAKTFFNLPYQVSYSALSLPTVPYTSPHSASNAILAKILTHKFLHHEIREKGGAYGGGAYNKGLGGVWGMYSYRDPNPENTLSIYGRALEWAERREWSDREMEEAKLSVFQGLDAPVSVNAEGMERFSAGITHEMEQTRRQQLLDVKEGDVREAAGRLAEEVKNKASIALLGERKAFVREADGWVANDMGMGGKEAVQEEGGTEGDGAAAAAAAA